MSELETPDEVRHVIVMGVSGSGKSTIAEGIAESTGWTFAEADEFHPRSNIEKMEAGTPLTDEDRWPWLEALAAWMCDQAAEDRSTVITCSALRRPYRDLLRRDLASLDFIHLDGPAEVIRERMSGRKGHFMPPELLQSQIDTLEPLDPDESGVVLDLRHTPDELVAEALAWLGVQPDVSEAGSDD